MNEIYTIEEGEQGEILSTLNRPTEVEAFKNIAKYEKFNSYKLTDFETMVLKYERELVFNRTEPDSCLPKLCDKFGGNKKLMSKILKNITLKLEYQEHIGIYRV